MNGWWIAGLFVTGVVAWSLLEHRRLRALASARAGWTVEQFVAHFRARGASPELARDVWDALQGILAPPVPLRPSDRPLGRPLHLDEEDVDLALEPVLGRHRILIDDRDRPWNDTIEELVMLLDECRVR